MKPNSKKTKYEIDPDYVEDLQTSNAFLREEVASNKAMIKELNKTIYALSKQIVQQYDEIEILEKW